MKIKTILENFGREFLFTEQVFKTLKALNPKTIAKQYIENLVDDLVDDRLDELKQSLDDVEGETTTQGEDISSLESRIDDLESVIEDLKRELNKLDDRLDEVEIGLEDRLDILENGSKELVNQEVKNT